MLVGPWADKVAAPKLTCFILLLLLALFLCARQGDGNLAIALNESALYLGSAIGAATGGVLLLLNWPMWLLAAAAAFVAAAALRRQLPAARRV